MVKVGDRLTAYGYVKNPNGDDPKFVFAVTQVGVVARVTGLMFHDMPIVDGVFPDGSTLTMTYNAKNQADPEAYVEKVNTEVWEDPPDDMDLSRTPKTGWKKIWVDSEERWKARPE